VLQDRIPTNPSREPSKHTRAEIIEVWIDRFLFHDEFFCWQPSAAVVTRRVEFVFRRRVTGECEREWNSLPNMEGPLPTDGVQPKEEIGWIVRKISRVSRVEACRDSRWPDKR
jgi:hypothetical protein